MMCCKAKSHLLGPATFNVPTCVMIVIDQSDIVILYFPQARLKPIVQPISTKHVIEIEIANTKP